MRCKEDLSFHGAEKKCWRLKDIKIHIKAFEGEFFND